MYHRIIATLALTFIFYTGFGQEAYHRLYETNLNVPSTTIDTLFYHMSSTTTEGDVFAMGTKRVGDEDLTIVFTKHDYKGNIKWSKELDLGQDSVEILSLGDYNFNGTQDSILFTINANINGDPAMIFGRLEGGGNLIDLRTVGGSNPLSDVSARSLTAPFFGQSDLLLRPSVLPTINRIGPADSLVWSRTYEFNNTDGDIVLDAVTDIKQSADSTFVITGTSNNGGEEFVVAKLDSNGVQLWAESYTFSVAGIENILPVEVRSLSDRNTAVVGTYGTGGSSVEGFVAVLDTAGGIIMAENIIVEGNNTDLINFVEGDDGTLWISGIVTQNDSTLYFTTNMSLDGTINWTTFYNQEVSFTQPFTTTLLNVQSTGGATLVGHGFKDDTEVMHVMKHNAQGVITTDGVVPCSDTLTTTTIDLVMLSDTLTSTIENGGLFYNILEHELNGFSGFTPPQLNIDQQYPPFCPNEVIDTLLIASVSGVDPENVSYMWSTGEFSDTIRVMEEGQYSVTVTVNQDICFKMCDTIELTRLMLPGIAITQDNNQFCENGIVVLTGNYTPGALGETYLWNTGEITPSIDVTEPGLYSVTVTDDCGEMASDALEMALPDISFNANGGPNFVNFCTNGGVELNTGVVPADIEFDNFSYEWSTGPEDTADSLIVNEDGMYQVTISNQCGVMEIINYDITVPVIPTTGEITFDLNCNEENPNLSTIEFEGTSEIGDQSYLDLTISDLINPLNSVTGMNPSGSLSLSSYYVELKICEEIVDSLNIDTRALCGGLLRYPIAFFPGGQDEFSTTFGPIPSDTMNLDRISDVEFKVFNRWGETVFESNAILEAWDGTHKGEPAPSEVYIWYVSYFIDGQQILEKGDVTLLR
ncbi:MAG: gliding motility-associated C-terminal domain-containing protein [Saprospiraceae bacterium]|nr:gliding motility-associated C-terminal domain-containing protein [Saprospiraceae bacterium]